MGTDRKSKAGLVSRISAFKQKQKARLERAFFWASCKARSRGDKARSRGDKARSRGDKARSRGDPTKKPARSGLFYWIIKIVAAHASSLS